MAIRELRYPHQIHQWLQEWGALLTVPGEMILIGSGALLLQAWVRGIDTPLPENSMDVDPITASEEIALLGYDALVGSEFEKIHGWHVNLMPQAVLREFPADWRSRATVIAYGQITVILPAVSDLLIPKLKRGEPRDKKHIEWAKNLQLQQ